MPVTRFTTQFVQFLSTDGLRLPGMLFEPKQPTKHVAINLHGNGSSSVFYSPERALSMAQALNDVGIAFFTFNNRGAHYIKKLKYDDGKREIKLGTAYELLRECVADIDGAIAYLRTQGYEQFTLIGHSTGANKIAVYNWYQKEHPVTRFVLLGGGDDTGLLRKMVGGTAAMTTLLRQARERISGGQGHKLIPAEWLSGMLLSYQSFVDTADPDGDYNSFPFDEYEHHLKLSTKPLFWQYQSIQQPMLVIYGDQDEYCSVAPQRALDILREHTGDPTQTTFEIIAQADHGFSGREAALAARVAAWLA